MHIHKEARQAYLYSFLWIGHMFVTQVLDGDEAGDTIIHPCLHPDRLARTLTSIKMVPHLQSNNMPMATDALLTFTL